MVLEKKSHLVKWSIVCSDKRKGALGVRCLSKLNKGLLGKWCWHFVEERGTPWNQVISRKYGVEEGRCMVWGFGRKIERNGLL